MSMVPDGHNYEFMIGENRYTGVKFTYTKGLPLALAIGALVPELLTTALDQVKGDLARLAAAEGKVEAKDLILSIQSVDLASLGAPLQRALGSLAANPALLHGILMNTYFNGEPLGKPDVRDKAFTANYGEAFKVIAEVVKVNGWLPF